MFLMKKAILSLVLRGCLCHGCSLPCMPTQRFATTRAVKVKMNSANTIFTDGCKQCAADFLLAHKMYVFSLKGLRYNLCASLYRPIVRLCAFAPAKADRLCTSPPNKAHEAHWQLR
jgi:hypothetical protein